jgi:hypothetical protein
VAEELVTFVAGVVTTMFEMDKENAVCRWFNGTTLVDNAARIRQLIGL